VVAMALTLGFGGFSRTLGRVSLAVFRLKHRPAKRPRPRACSDISSEIPTVKESFLVAHRCLPL